MISIIASVSVFGDVKPLKIPTTHSPQGIQVIVEYLDDDDVREWGLSVPLIQSKVEQTLLGFNLEPSDDEPYIKGYFYVRFSPVGAAYSLSVAYNRPVELPSQSGYYTAEVWDESLTGINPSKDKYKILNSIEELTSMFATEYIKQNRRPTQ